MKPDQKERKIQKYKTWTKLQGVMCKQNQFVAESNLYHSWLAALPETENRDGHVPQFITSPAASFWCLQNVLQETCLYSTGAKSGEKNPNWN